MTPELKRALMPKTTLAWQVAHYTAYAMTIHSVTLNLLLAAYLESLKLSGVAK